VICPSRHLLRATRRAGLTGRLSRSHERATRMRPETKFLRLKAPVTIGSRFGEWRVYWLGGWTRDRLSFLVMLAREPNRR
jgi:hypothetical protein